MISDVAWNPQFNMIAVAGFGSDLPVILYVYEKSAEEIEDNYTGLMDDYKIPDHLVPHKEVISNLAYEVRDRY